MGKFQRLAVEGDVTYLFFCPGCGMCHFVRVEGKQPIWKLSGLEDDSPTVKPSIRVRHGDNLCHSFVTGGRIQYLNDSTHKLAGQTIDIPDFDEGTA